MANDRTGATPKRVWITYWHPLKAEDGAILGINVAAEKLPSKNASGRRCATGEQIPGARTLELTGSLEELRDAKDRLVQTKKLAITRAN
jgi:hypothetical protein